ncbi:MAG TPA: chromate efflux transporter [Polyangiaceae bacterium]|nr:chromate efflux transporter [Polyangiaceae bacterium]
MSGSTLTTPVTDPPATTLRELALLFGRLGATAFGGPAAHIAMMRDEVVHRRGWLTEARFLDLLGATQLIPGPNSTELAIHIGWERRRWSGLIVAGLAFILPAMAITFGFAWAYLRLGSLPALGWLLYGVKPVMLGVIAQAILGLAPTAARTLPLALLGAAVLLLAALGVHEIGLLFAAGAAALFCSRAPVGERAGGAVLPLAPVVPVAALTGVVHTVTLPALFAVFLKIGSVLFGSGYVLLAFLRADLVQRLGWLSESQLIDAIAVGQITPGPVFTTATFIGYLLAGPSGALVATAGIFLPAFVFVALSGPLVPRLRASPRAGAFLDGINVASLALMALVTLQLGRAALVDVPTLVLAVLAALILVRFKPNASWLVLGGAGAGWLLHTLGLAG